MDEQERDELRKQLPEVNEKFLDIEATFRSKSKATASLIPGFVYAYLKRVTHQDWLNNLIYANEGNWGLGFVDACLEGFSVEPVVVNEQNIPRNERSLIASNHPLGGIDGLALMQVVGKVRKDIVFPVNDILMSIPQLQELFIPVNKHGSNIDNVKIINNTYSSDVCILYFPAGLVSRKQSGVIRDLEWKKSFITRARRFKRDIVPVFIGGGSSGFFYRLANIRKNIHLKANIEMLYLVDEMMKLKDKNFKIIFGKSIPWVTFDKRFPDNAWAEKMKEHVYALESDPDKEFEYIIEAAD